MPVSATKTWNDGEQLTATDLNARFVNIEAATQQVATQNEVNLGVSTTTSLTPNHNKIILGTATGTTSGTSATLSSSIPTGTRRITVSFIGVSTNGTSNWMIQIGDSGGIETTGYLGAVTTVATATPSTGNFTSGFGLTNAIAAASVAHGTAILTLENAANFTWSCISILGLSNAATTHYGASSKSLSAELTSLQIITVGGTDTFDAGQVNITYER